MSSSASVTIPCSIAKLVSDSNAAVEFAKRGRANLTPNFRLVCVLQFDRLLNEELNFGPGARKISLKLLTSRVWALSSFVPWMLISAPAHFSSPDVRPANGRGSLRCRKVGTLPECRRSILQLLNPDFSAKLTDLGAAYQLDQGQKRRREGKPHPTEKPFLGSNSDAQIVSP